MEEFFVYAQNLSLGGFLLIALFFVLGALAFVFATIGVVVAGFGIRDIIRMFYSLYQNEKKTEADQRRQQQTRLVPKQQEVA